MKRKALATLTVLTALGLFSGASASEKLMLATAMKAYPLQMLLVMTGEEKGIFKKNGLEAEWTAFDSGPLLQRAVASGSVDMWMQSAGSQIQAAFRGIPVLIVADPKVKEEFFFYVKNESPLKAPRDLRGAKIGVTQFGGSAHAYGRAVVKALGLEKDVKFVSLGGATHQVAALRSGTTDVEVSSHTFASLRARGEVRTIIAVREFLPKEWIDTVVAARKEFAHRRPEATRRTVRALREAGDFIVKNAQWSQERIKAQWGYDENLSRTVHGELQYGPDFNINRKALENVLNFLIEYGIISKEKAPLVDELYTNEFVG